MLRGRPSPFAVARFRARVAALALGLAIVAVAVGCGSSTTPSVAPTPAPTPRPSVDPHLEEPVSADQVFVALGSANLGIVATSAGATHSAKGIVKQIYADIGSWPLRITEFTDATALRNALRWKAGVAPGRNESAYAFAGMNVLIQYGPLSQVRAPAPADSSRQALAAKIVAVLDPLLWPLAQHSIVEIPTRPAASKPPAASAPAKGSTKPTRTPKPSPRP